MEKNGQRYLMEVKGCTLEINGTGYFPDAPTDRGVKHLYELIRAVKEGYRAAAAFVIQMDGVTQVQANTDTHPAFGTALEEAVAAGVEVLCLPCHVEPDSLCVVEQNIWLWSGMGRGSCRKAESGSPDTTAHIRTANAPGPERRNSRDRVCSGYQIFVLSDICLPDICYQLSAISFTISFNSKRRSECLKNLMNILRISQSWILFQKRI